MELFSLDSQLLYSINMKLNSEPNFTDPVRRLTHQSQRELDFEKTEYKKGFIVYNFGNVTVTIDDTGKNYNKLPEISFRTRGLETGAPSLQRPEVSLDGVDMNLVSKCLKEVAKDSQIHEFWFSPFGGDHRKRFTSDYNNHVEYEEKRKQARVRLFSRFMDVTPEPEGLGYIIKL